MYPLFPSSIGPIPSVAPLQFCPYCHLVLGPGPIVAFKRIYYVKLLLYPLFAIFGTAMTLIVCRCIARKPVPSMYKYCWSLP